MKEILKFIDSQALAYAGQTNKYLFAGFCVISGFFLLNFFLSPYCRHNRLAKRANKLLETSIKTRRSVPVGKLRLPEEYFDGFQNYRSSQSRFPSEFVSFRERRQRCLGEITMLICLIAWCSAAIANGVNFGFSETSVVLLVGLSIAYLAAKGILRFVFAFKTLHAKALARRLGRCLDMAFGERYFAGTNSGLSEACLDSDIDDTVAKIEFLKAGGISSATAKEVAALLSNERLNKPRTQEQQKKLNGALSGLLQALSASAQKQTGAGPLQS